MEELELSRYTTKEVIHRGQRAVIYRGIRNKDQKACIFKALVEEYPSLSSIARLQHERHILQNVTFSIDHRYLDFINENNKFALILDDEGEISLSEFINSSKITIPQFLIIAINLSENLSQLHERGIIHKDIKPENILINPKTLVGKFIDFSISTLLTQETQKAQNPNILEGSLSYMSPEQTGRMNRYVDYRTDFYSLGVAFFELLTRSLPFQATNALEIVYAHIAKPPKFPENSSLEIPQIIINIVIKLMAKTAEERYQNALGLKNDLQECFREWNESGSITTFPLGKKDISFRFRISQKLYGRDKEKETLLSAFERISKGAAEILLVSGYPGIGKTSLVQEIDQPILKKRGYFVSGKYDQFQRGNIPYAALIQSFKQLIQKILSEEKERIEVWKQRFLEALGINAQIIIDLVPEIEFIIGPQPLLLKIGSKEAQTRFNLTLLNFVHALATEEHPLIIFMDDIQWIDLSSLKFLEQLLANPKTLYLLIIGSYRDNEVNQSHPLVLSLEEMKKNGVLISSIFLNPLEEEHVIQLISDTLHAEPKDVQSLAELCYQKTHGNPFFFTQFLQTLVSEKLLFFDFSQEKWLWDVENISSKGITDNVVDLMIRAIQKLDSTTQKVLQLAACIGTRFDLKTLAMVNERSMQETAHQLWDALMIGLIVPLNENYKYVQNTGDNSFSYSFLHDRVQQATYSMLDEQIKKKTHLIVARDLEKIIKEKEENIFNIVNHYNFAIDLIDKPEEKLYLANLNLIGGQKAKNSNSYDSAFKYLMQGISLLGDNDWERNYSLTLSLYDELTEVAYLTGNVELVNKNVEAIFLHAATLIDKIKAINFQILTLITIGKLQESISTGLNALKELGISINPKANPLRTIFEAFKTMFLLRNHNASSLEKLPIMTDPKKLAALNIMSALSGPAYRSSPLLFSVITFHAIRLMLSGGNNGDFSPHLYAGYGVISCGIFSKFERGCQYGTLAVNLLNLLPNAMSGQSKVFMVQGGWILHWKEHIRECWKLTNEGVQAGLNTGEFEYVAYNLFVSTAILFFSGEPLKEALKKASAYKQIGKEIQQKSQYCNLCAFYQSMMNFAGKAENPTQLIGEGINENELIDFHEKSNDMAGLFFTYLNMSIVRYHFHDYKEAAKTIKQNRKYIEAMVSGLSLPLFYFYDSLIQLAIYPDETPQNKKQLLKQVKKNQKLMKTWSETSPKNYLHRYFIIEAECAKFRGDELRALHCYEKGISLAKKYLFLNDEGLANELFAKFYYLQGNEIVARVYVKEAYQAYLNWHAEAKAKDLEREYPFLKQREMPLGMISTLTTTLEGQESITTSTASEMLDFISIIKASQAISKEIELNGLVVKLLKILMENTGADRVALFLKKNQQMFFEGEIIGEGKYEKILNHIPYEKIEGFPLSLLNYVYRTKKSIVLNEDSKKAFESDVYISQDKVKSILCFSMTYQDNLVGIIYCENRILPEVFNQDRYQILKILSSQIAVSITNATLYTELANANKRLEDYSVNLEEKVEQRTKELKAMQKQVIQQEKLASLGTLTRGVAHEIQNPLNFVTNFSQLSAEDTQDLIESCKQSKINIEEVIPSLEDILTNITVVNKNGLRIASLVKSMQEHAQITRKEREMPELTDISQMIVAYCNLIQSDYKRSSPLLGVEIIYNFENTDLIPIFPKEFGRALYNLIDNAFYALNQKKNRDSNFAPRLTIKTRKSEKFLKINVLDNGIGIPTKEIDNIFLPFFTTKPTGTGHAGLGLYLAHEIIAEAHSGTLTVSSKEGESTEFTVSLPL